MALGNLPCVEFVESISDYIEHVLDEPARSAIETHLLVCEGCTDYLTELRRTIAALHLGGEAAVSPPPDARQALLDVFRREKGGSPPA